MVARDRGCRTVGPSRMPPVGALHLAPPLGADHAAVSGKSREASPRTRTTSRTARRRCAIPVASTNAAKISFVTANRSIAEGIEHDVVDGLFAVARVGPHRVVAHAEQTGLDGDERVGMLPRAGGHRRDARGRGGVVTIVTRDATRVGHGASVPAGLRRIPLHARTCARPRAARAQRARGGHDAPRAVVRDRGGTPPLAGHARHRVERVPGHEMERAPGASVHAGERGALHWPIVHRRWPRRTAPRTSSTSTAGSRSPPRGTPSWPTSTSGASVTSSGPRSNAGWPRTPCTT